ncbi:MAG: sigma-54 dependent transcriptional regulator [Gemmataceae bacterium]|nr:sigma-54 dependent transcriptional regulator [Gemmataceae bacterium]MDW8266210.1 sigma-54 dependent transcriptional regulator [Gemmataceae bacterium]
MAVLLVIDDDPDILLTYLDHAVGDLFERIEVARTGAEGLELYQRGAPTAVLLDVYLSDAHGLELMQRLRGIDCRCPILIITAATTTDLAIEAVRQGAFEYLIKPPGVDELREVLTRAIEVHRQMKVPALIEETQEPAEADVLVGRCRAMREVFKAIGQVADRDVAVLILGETGTGKELVARAIYQYSRRAERPFLAINCAALPEEILESELFGHEQGAFTGAVRQRIGKFEQCSGGTLFLDEVGDFSPAIQGKVLRLLQEQRFERVGGNETIRTDVRILAATNRDLGQMVRDGLFRADLYYRLCVSEIRLPPLRERDGDVPLLTQHFVRRFAQQFGKEVVGVSPEAMALLERYTWPGNVRELQNVVRQALLRTTGDTLVPDALPEHIRSGTLVRPAAARTGSEPTMLEMLSDVRALTEDLLRGGGTRLYESVHQAVDRCLLSLVLDHTQGNQLRASQVLGITRRTLRNKLRDLDLHVTRRAVID